MINAHTNTRTSALSALRRRTSFAAPAMVADESPMHTRTARLDAAVAPCAAATAPLAGVDAVDAPMAVGFLATLDDLSSELVPLDDHEPDPIAAAVAVAIDSAIATSASEIIDSDAFEASGLPSDAFDVFCAVLADACDAASITYAWYSPIDAEDVDIFEIAEIDLVDPTLGRDARWLVSMVEYGFALAYAVDGAGYSVWDVRDPMAPVFRSFHGRNLTGAVRAFRQRAAVAAYGGSDADYKALRSAWSLGIGGASSSRGYESTIDRTPNGRPHRVLLGDHGYHVATGVYVLQHSLFGRTVFVRDF